MKTSFCRNGILRTYAFGKAYCGQYCSQYAFFLTKDYIPVFLIGVRGNNMSDKKYFVLRSGGKDTSQVFASRQPRGAALKAATRGATDIRLRERGTKKVHVFKGSVSMVDKPANGPDWLPDKIKKANVKKVGIEHL